MCEGSLICQDAAHIRCDFFARPRLRSGRDGDSRILVVLLVELIELALDRFLLFCAVFASAERLIPGPSLSTLDRLHLRRNVWDVGPTLSGSLCGSNWKFFNQRHYLGGWIRLAGIEIFVFTAQKKPVISVQML